MEKLVVELLNPKVEQILLELESLKLISIKNPEDALLDEIVKEVKIVRAERYAEANI